jgi:hypothetical protein
VLAKDQTEVFESGLEWAERYGHRPTDPTLPVERDEPAEATAEQDGAPPASAPDEPPTYPREPSSSPRE